MKTVTASARSTRLITRGWLLLLSAVALIVPMLSLGQGTFQGVTITFDGTPAIPPGSAISVQNYYESNVWFRPINSGSRFIRVGPNPVPGRPDNVTAYVQAALGDTMMFSLTNGMLFELHSVDLAEYSTVSPAAKTITIIGYRPDGSSVSVTGTTDGIIDGGGPLDDFQTFGFQGFTGLSRVEIPSYGWSLDNVRLFVPEPSHTALLILAAAAFRVRRK